MLSLVYNDVHRCFANGSNITALLLDLIVCCILINKFRDAVNAQCIAYLVIMMFSLPIVESTKLTV